MKDPVALGPIELSASEAGAPDAGALFQRLGAHNGLRATGRAVVAVLLAFAVTAIPILISGKSPIAAYWALLHGAFGSFDHVAFALNKSTPYILTAVGVALCFRAQIINIGGEGQIAVGGLAASWVALNCGDLPSLLAIVLALAAGAVAGALWAGIAAVIRLTRGVHEVLSTLLLNFVGVLLVSEALNGAMGEAGAGFPQSPMFDEAVRLPTLFSGYDLHVGLIIALVVTGCAQFLLWRTRFGFQLRLLGGSRAAAAYAGVSFAGGVIGVMLLGGGLAGLAGGIEVLGVHYRLIEGFSLGFGFTGVAVALLAAANPLAVVPAGLFFGFLQAGALAMQREVGVPSSLVYVIQGFSIVFVLCAIGLDRRWQRV
ncbi:ABC transporter permease [Methylocapsa sp. S129]|uniref:ABC transporter permease n=1 Tax=Methylocapsa sp. S129 TaxID=1641869 RepID=UPI00131DB987|nr:ABC transporter permease [Methylocapsa sp. S129]